MLVIEGWDRSKIPFKGGGRHGKSGLFIEDCFGDKYHDQRQPVEESLFGCLVRVHNGEGGKAAGNWSRD